MPAGKGLALADRDTMWSLVLGAAVFAVYAAGACPTIFVGDSGELVTAVHVLGVPHPTGYPLYVLLGKPWTLLVPFGSIAYRMSLFSAACGGVACAIFYRLCRACAFHPLAALFAALTLAFSPSFWGEANVQRVYTLGSIFVVLATAAAFRWWVRRDAWSLGLAFFFCGVGATNHTIMAIYAIMLGLFVFLSDPRVLLRWRSLAASALGFAIGLLPYAYLPIASSRNPPLDWGKPDTWQGFLGVVLRRGFWVRAWIEEPRDLLTIGWDYVTGLGHELAWVGLALALVGVVAGWRRRFPVLLPILVMLGNLAVMAAHGSRADIFIWHRYYIPSYVMAALLAGLGASALLERLPAPARFAPLAVPAFLLVTGWPQFDRSRFVIADEFSRNLLRSLPPGASLIASDDNILFVLIYLHMVEDLRPDVNLVMQGVGGADLPSLRFNPDTDPLYFTHHPNWNMPALDIVPVGLAFRAWRRGSPPPDPVIPMWELTGETDPRVPKDYLTQNLVGQLHYMIGFTFEQRDWLHAQREFAVAAERSPYNDVLFYNLGLIYQRNGLYDDAVEAFEHSYEINPRHLASQGRARAIDKLDELKLERDRVERLVTAAASSSEMDGLPRGSAAWYDRIAQLLEEKGEDLAARGERLKALERAGAR